MISFYFKWLNLDEYDKKALFEPTVLNLLVLGVVYSFAVAYSAFHTSMILSVVETLFPIVVFAIVMRAVMGIFRRLSKMLLQNWIFGKGMVNMPTTEFLLHKSNFGDRSIKSQVRKVIKERFGASLPSEYFESQNDSEARKQISMVVARIREYIRHLPKEHRSDYDRCNIRYGFTRNFLGGAVVVLPAIIALQIYSYVTGGFFIAGLVACLIYVFAVVVLSFSLKCDAEDYARSLFVTFLNN